MTDNLLEIKNLKKYFPIKKGLLLREVGKLKLSMISHSAFVAEKP